MIDVATIKRLTDLCSKPVALGGWLGMPYEENGCLKFCIRFYHEMGIATDEKAMREARNFFDVAESKFGDLALFNGVGAWHVGVMLNRCLMVQCSQAEITNGVGTVAIDIYPWAEHFRGFKRHKDLCS